MKKKILIFKISFSKYQLKVPKATSGCKRRYHKKILCSQGLSNKKKSVMFDPYLAKKNRRYHIPGNSNLI